MSKPWQAAMMTAPNILTMKMMTKHGVNGVAFWRHHNGHGEESGSNRVSAHWVLSPIPGAVGANGAFR